MTQQSGKKRKFTSRQAAFLRLWATPPYSSIKQCAKAAGVSDQTAYNWKMEQPDFWDACENARAESQMEYRRRLEDRIFEMADAAMTAKLENLTADSPHVRHLESTWILEKLIGKTAERREITGNDGGPVEHTHALDMTGFADDELRAIVARARTLSAGGTGEA